MSIAKTAKGTANTSTWGISPQVRKALSRLVLDARTSLEDDFRRQLSALGIRTDGTSKPVRGLNAEESTVRMAATAVTERAEAAGASHQQALETFIRDSAFTFLNRVIGLRCLEERGMLVVDGRTETAIREDPRLGASSLYFRTRNELSGDSSPRDVWSAVLERSFRALSERVGLLFDPNSEYGRLLPLQSTLRDIVQALNDPSILPEVWHGDEVLGWVYQYYNTDEKDAVYDKLAQGGKIDNPAELAAATCLYTEPYMVDFILQNTLGTLWAEMHPSTRLSIHWPHLVRSELGQPKHEGRNSRQFLRDVTLLDPACGSGHFLARAFDLLVQMYQEEGLEKPEDIPHLILENNLHGIDIDLRAVQISALRLYLKACDIAGHDFRPRRLNLVSADVVLPGSPPPELLERFEGDRDVQALMTAMWFELKDAAKLGSLLHPERRVEELIARRRQKGPTLEFQDEGAWERYKLELLDGIREEFEKEAQIEDVGRHLFGHELAKSISLVEALSRRYDVVVTNPPYAGSNNLDAVVKTFIESNYKEGKRDLYAAFILRDIEFARPGGLVGMVAQQSWLFLRSFAKLRGRVLNSATVTTLAHLGAQAFEEIGGEVVRVALFTIRCEAADDSHRITAFRLIGPKSPSRKDQILRAAVAGTLSGVVFTPKQSAMRAIPETPFVYWLRPRFFELLTGDVHLSQIADVKQGLATADNERFIRCYWEVPRLGVLKDGKPTAGRWFWYAKGGRYQKWTGLEWLVVDWARDGKNIKEYIVERYPYLNGKWEWVAKNTNYYFRPCITYTFIARGSLGLRLLDESVFDVASMSIFANAQQSGLSLMAVLNSRVSTYLLRVTTQTYEFHGGYVANLPLPDQIDDLLDSLSDVAIALKRRVIATDLTEREFDAGAVLFGTPANSPKSVLDVILAEMVSIEGSAAILHSLEGWNETLVVADYKLGKDDVQAVIEETGSPAGWYPLIANYDGLPDPPGDIQIPDGFRAYLSSLPHRVLSDSELSTVKKRLAGLYASARGAKSQEVLAVDDPIENDDEIVLGAHIPIPSETLIEELSHKLQIHPISVYRLIEELRPIGSLSSPQIRSNLEDWISTAILELLGYAWPEAGRNTPGGGQAIDQDLVDRDGIIPLVQCDKQPTTDERIRTYMDRRFGADGAARSLEEFRTCLGRSLPEWLESEFFTRHVQQFKQRPIAWHVTSPKGTFQAFVLYHRLGRDTLRRLRDVYAGALVNRLKGDLQRAEERRNARVSEELRFRIEDVEDFRDRILAIEQGRELHNRIRCRWKDEEESGRSGPYTPDLDDGVKVNIRPFQETGVLARDVIRKW